ncbi:NADH dehydrogenase [ubiquinone] 1 beta subcomplex subunit 1 isoform X1 [Glossina fuscipes]|uniref:NADH dehydrogenase [ubiquinone] 1 beta subcomplex subunit 1 isoform X1 n=1 Tax=Glossina fuscipes TaxID=7396 RepID=A0A9C5Z6G0_9MUSC|nr:NADH dehydrogenase [ubiquinone] 1 beta subcomplex subunit 1 isoform X1 [Glossina fuscipes]
MLGLDRGYIWGVLPLIGFAIGHFLDKKETERMTMFRDKSALYGRAEVLVFLPFDLYTFCINSGNSDLVRVSSYSFIRLAD